MYMLYDKMRSEVASLWYAPTSHGGENALIIKAPTPTIKALIVGCSMQLIYGKKDSCLCIGARINDMPDTPVLISRAQTELQEHQTLISLMKDKRFNIFIYNEMDICVASASAKISNDDSLSFLKFIQDQTSFYVGKLDDNVSHAVDCFDFSIDNTRLFPNAHKIPLIEIYPAIKSWNTKNIYFLHDDFCCEINVANEDEGDNFEKTIWASLKSVFPSTLYKSPEVDCGNKKREFTDIFTYYEYGSFIIEAKDLSVIQVGYNKNELKRVSGIQKQVDKAIRQLIGAAKNFKHDAHLLDTNGNEISVDRSIPPHCIVLITELMTSGNWDAITEQLLNAINETGAYFHILDLREFMTLLKQSSGDPKLIDYNLIERCKLCMEKKSILIRGI